MLKSIEVCAGAGGQALGLEAAGFSHLALVEIDEHACETLRLNRPGWPVVRENVKHYSAAGWANQGVDLLAAGVPCPPFSVAGKRLGRSDERDLFPEVLRLVGECSPRAILVENVPGLLDPPFSGYREDILLALEDMGYVGEWKKLNASDFGVPQLRPRALLVAMLPKHWPHFAWPTPLGEAPLTVGEALYGEMASRGWRGAREWAAAADRVAPTLVGGSKKHGGPDLGPTRAKEQWAALGVNGKLLALEPPAPDHQGMPHLTVRMAATIQGFPTDWQFFGAKTSAYRQVGNAFPPPVAKAAGYAIASALNAVDLKSGEGRIDRTEQETLLGLREAAVLLDVSVDSVLHR